MKGYIYEITSPSTNKYYIGSTIMQLAKRFVKHKQSFRYKKSYTTAFEILCYDDAEIKELEAIDVGSFQELAAREREWILANPECVNVRCKLTDEQRVLRIKESNKKYYAKHKAEIQERRKTYNNNSNINRKKKRIEARIKQLQEQLVKLNEP